MFPRMATFCVWLLAAGAAVAQVMTPVTFLPGDEAIGAAPFDQEQPAIARGGDQYLVAWTDYRTGGSSLLLDESGADVFAARLDAAGNTIDTAPLRLTMAPGDQTDPRVAWNGDSWLVVWLSQTPTQFFWSIEVQAARVSAAGEVLDPSPITIFKYPFSSSAEAAVASDGAGWAVVTRGTSGGESDVRGVRVLADGTVLDPGGVVMVPAVGPLTFNLGLAFALDEYFLTYLESGSLLGRRFDPALTAIDGAPFSIGSGTGSIQSPRVASNGLDFLCVWRSYSSGTQIGEARAARVSHGGQVLDPAGIALSGPLFIGGDDPRAAWDGSVWVTTFKEFGEFGGDLDVLRAARVTVDGQVLDPGGVPVEPAPGVFLFEHQIAGDAAGGVRVVWSDDRAGGPTPYDVSTYALASDLTPGPSSVVSLGVPAQTQADVAAAGDGYMTVYLSSTASERRVMAQPLDAAGNALLAEPLELAVGPTLAQPAVAWNGSLYLAVWSEVGVETLDDSVVFGQRLAADGTPVDAAPVALMEGFSPDVAAAGDLFLAVAIQQTTTTEIRQPFGLRVRGSDGAILDPAPIVLGSSFAGAPSVAGVGGRWLMSYQRNFSHDDPNAEIQAAFVEADGATSAPLLVSSGLGSFLYDPDVASDGTDAFVVWEDSGDDDVSGARVLGDGTVLAPVSVSGAAEAQDRPAVGWDGGRYVTLYQDLRNISFFLDERSDVFATRVDAAGNPLDGAGFAVHDTAVPEIDPAVAGAGGTALLAASVFRDVAPYMAYRVGVRLLTDGPPAGDLTVGLTPLDTPIVIDPAGGFYRYQLEITNPAADSRTFDFWMVLEGPGLARTIGPRSLTLVAGASLVRTLRQNIPAGAAAGSYTHSAFVGVFPDTVEASDVFSWEKLAASQAE